MLEVLAHANLPHQLVLVAVHAGQLADVRKYVLEAVRQLQTFRTEVQHSLTVT